MFAQGDEVRVSFPELDRRALRLVSISFSLLHTLDGRRTLNVSILICQTTKAPTFSAPPLTSEYPVMLTLFAQHTALVSESSVVLSDIVIPFPAIESKEAWVEVRLCSRIQ